MLLWLSSFANAISRKRLSHVTNTPFLQDNQKISNQVQLVLFRLRYSRVKNYSLLVKMIRLYYHIHGPLITMLFCFIETAIMFDTTKANSLIRNPHLAIIATCVVMIMSRGLNSTNLIIVKLYDILKKYLQKGLKFTALSYLTYSRP